MNEMKTLTQVIAGDLREVGKVARGMMIGSVRGLYTPHFAKTGLDQLVDSLEEDLVRFVSQLFVGIGSVAVVGSYAAVHGRGKEYLAVLAVTNFADYIKNAYERSKQGDD
jgi:hypothetical protein